MVSRREAVESGERTQTKQVHYVVVIYMLENLLLSFRILIRRKRTSFGNNRNIIISMMRS